MLPSSASFLSLLSLRVMMAISDAAKKALKKIKSTRISSWSSVLPQSPVCAEATEAVSSIRLPSGSMISPLSKLVRFLFYSLCGLALPAKTGEKGRDSSEAFLYHDNRTPCLCQEAQNRVFSRFIEDGGVFENQILFTM